MSNDATEKQNLIYLVADSLRPDVLGCYGGDTLTTEIDRLAKRGVRFDDVISSAPWTVPSVSAHSTGVYSHNLQIFTPDIAIDERTETVFERFSSAGYETAAYFDSQRRRNQFDAGVDHYGWAYDIENLLDFISQNATDRFFAFGLYRGTHLPYVLKYSRESWFRAVDELMERLRHGGEEGIEELKHRYRRSVEQFSEWYLRAILDRLEDEGILEETAIVITGDHGEHWGQRMDDQSSMDLFDLHGTHLYDEVLRVPLVMFNFGSEEDVEATELTRTIDILPTILDAFGMDAETNHGRSMDGRSLAPIFEGELEQVEFPDVAFSTTTSSDEGPNGSLPTISRAAAIKGKYKLIYRAADGETELYDRVADPEETADLAGANPEIVDELTTLILDQVGRQAFETSPEESEELREQLEDLGYL